MSMSPQSGGFQEGAGPRPRKRPVATSPSPRRAPSGEHASSALISRFFVGESDICVLGACAETARIQCSAPEDKTKPLASRMAQKDELMNVTNIADPGQLTRDADVALERIAAARSEVGSVIFGQERVVDLTLATLLAGGHGLLIGVPGLAKTKLVETLGIVVGLDALRVQFTPDLMPSDILGSEVMEEGHDGKRGFRFIKGPVFAQLLMADEINRASPRTQSALLQAMQEHHVTVAGARYDLPRPFHVLATQNPLEQEGAYPLPEAQLDRFLLQIDVSYPDRAAERRILIETTGEREARPKPVMTAEDLMAAQRLVRRAPIGDRVVEAILDLVRAGRPGEGDPELTKGIGWGPGPRAAQALMLAARARALVDGRLSPSLDDVAMLAEPALKHRMALSFAARAEGETISAVIGRLVAKTVR
jgi:MoxR-like ATPase